MSKIASAKGYKKAIENFNKSGGKERQYTTEYGGLKFRSYLKKDNNGQHYVDNVHLTNK